MYCAVFACYLRSPGPLVEGVAGVGFSGMTRRERWVAAVASAGFVAEGPRGLPTFFGGIASVVGGGYAAFRRDDWNVRRDAT
jgi:hypothetical protein